MKAEMRHTCGVRRRKGKKKKRMEKETSPGCQNIGAGLGTRVSPPCGSSRADNGPCLPRHKVFSVPAAASPPHTPPRAFFVLMEAIGCVQHSTSAARRVINHRVKETAGAQRPPEVGEKGPTRLYRDPGHP